MRGRRDVVVDGGLELLQHPQPADDPVLHLLFDVRLSAHRRSGVGRRRHALPRLPARWDRRTHHPQWRGLQHADGHSHILSSTIPNCVSYDPTYAYELAVIIHDGLRRMFKEQEDVFFYITLMNENYVQPAMPAGAEDGILKGMYLLQDGTDGKRRASNCSAQAPSCARSIGWRGAAAQRTRSFRRCLERAELHRAAPRRHRDRALEHAASDQQAAPQLRRRMPRRSARPGHRRQRLHAHLRRSNPSRTCRVATAC